MSHSEINTCIGLVNVLMVNFASLSLLCFCGAYHCCPNLQKNDVQLLFKSLELGKQSLFLQQACYLTPRPKILQAFWCKHSCAEPSFCSRGQKARHIMQSSALWSLGSYLLQTQSSQPSSATWSRFKVGFSAPQKCQQPAGNNSAATRWHGDATIGVVRSDGTDLKPSEGENRWVR